MQQPQRGHATFCGAPADYIVQTYFVLRVVIAGGALVLPVALLMWVAVDPDLAMMASISASYYTPARSLFVGTLVAIGVALVAYRGYTPGENLLLNAAGCLAIVVALVPTGDPALSGPTPASVVHAVAAVAFFVLVALSILAYGQQTVRSLPHPKLQSRYRTAYRMLAVLVLAFPAMALLIAWLMDSPAALFAVETAALYAFASFWIVKTYELSHAHEQARIV